ncbi:hypothetical protein K1T36_19685 [Pseudomonas protegens]|uniref:hypothetical protein n=1 Tax=Pseudomonas protegens TaxID=380021 RepID=UPI001C6A5914|nr:hypothetical protein [Pseudomonas protegens]QYM99298.1 hypothetical protein K1T36_19685 [Pseudomonas protegens]
MPSLRKYLSSGLLAVSAAVGGALLEASTDLLKKNFEPALISTRNTLEDWASPLPNNALIGLNLMFYIPTASGDEPWAEGMSATIPSKSCQKPGGYDIVRVFDASPNGHRTNAVVTIHCRSSGRVSVSLAPLSGETVQVYDGQFKDGDKVGFPGVPGSYYAGVLTMHWLDAVEPKGPWIPLNGPNEKQGSL